MPQIKWVKKKTQKNERVNVPILRVLPLAPVCTLIQFDKMFINFVEDGRQPPKIALNGMKKPGMTKRSLLAPRL